MANLVSHGTRMTNLQKQNFFGTNSSVNHYLKLSLYIPLGMLLSFSTSSYPLCSVGKNKPKMLYPEYLSPSQK